MEDVIELRVRMDCSGCEKKVRDALSKLKGVESVSVDRKAGKVVVTGWVERKKVLKAVRNGAGKSAELVMPTSIQGYNPYVKESDKFEKTYNYKKHGYNVLPNQMKNPATLIPKDGLAIAFSDDNANNCAIM